MTADVRRICVVIGRTRHKMVAAEIREAGKRGAALIELRIDFIARAPTCFPPVVINITDGKANDGDPRTPAAALRALATTDGPVLLLNAHLSSSPGPAVLFPAREEDLGDAYARLVFRMSSPLPPRLLEAARGEGFRLEAEARGFVFNADLVSVIRFLDIGTRVAQNVR